MFEKASRLKLRYDYKGVCSVEDLWDLSVKQLDSIFKKLNKNLKETNEESLLDVKTSSDKILELQVDIIRHIVEVKIQEQKIREERASKSSRKQKILAIIEEKQNAELYDKSVDDLTKLVEEL